MAKRDATGFRYIDLPNDQRMWADASGNRVVVKRAGNRFQAYQLIPDDAHHYSVGYLCTRDDIRRYLAGQAVELISEFGEDTEAEPLTFTHPALATF